MSNLELPLELKNIDLACSAMSWSSNADYLLGVFEQKSLTKLDQNSQDRHIILWGVNRLELLAWFK